MSKMNIRNINKLKCIVIVLVTLISVTISAQESKPLSREDRFTKLEPKMVFPLVKGSKMTGAIPVDFITNVLPSDTDMKLIFDFTQSTANNAQGSHINEGLEEVARILNLHIAAGLKVENLKAAVIFHSGSLLSILNDAYYQNKYGNDNPNSDMLNALMKNGIELIVCGQSMMLRELSPIDVTQGIQFALSAKTTLSKYQNAGYILFPINEK